MSDYGIWASHLPEPQSSLTVQRASRRVMLKAPAGPGHSRHVSLNELKRFVEEAERQGRRGCDAEGFTAWCDRRNVSLMDSQLYVDTPRGVKKEID